MDDNPATIAVVISPDIRNERVMYQQRNASKILATLSAVLHSVLIVSISLLGVLSLASIFLSHRDGVAESC